MYNENEFLDVCGEESQILLSHIRYDFPAVRICSSVILFNKWCIGLFDAKRISVSKTPDLLIFRDANTMSSFSICSLRKGGFYISGSRIKKITGLSTGTYFRLYPLKGGGYAIKRHEPIAVDKLEGCG